MAPLLSAFLCVVFAMPQVQLTESERALKSRAQEYAQAVQRGNYYKVWDLCSAGFRSGAGDDRQDFVNHVQLQTPHNYRVEVSCVKIWDEDGLVDLRFTSVGTEDVSDDGIYSSTWVLDNGVWVLDEISGPSDESDICIPDTP